MKSPYQIAKEIGVSPQAVYKKLTSEFINQLNNHIQRTEKGKYLIDEEAEQILKDLFNQVVQPVHQPIEQPRIEPVHQPLHNQFNSEIDFLREQNKGLQEELNKERGHSRAQADKLSNLAEQLAELSRNNQLLLGAEQSRTNSALLIGGKLAEQSEEMQQTKRSFWNLFKKK